MKTVLVTGAKGFIGRSLLTHLRRREDVRLREYDLGNTGEELRAWAREAEAIVHLAGVNRPPRVEDFEAENAGLTEEVCRILREAGRAPHVLLSSSIQATLDNPYGASKRHAEKALRRFSEETGATITIFRLKNVFGPGCRPNYNSVVATFCHNLAHDLPIQISDPGQCVDLVHVEDVVAAIVGEMDRPRKLEGGLAPPDEIPSYALTLGDLAGRIQFFSDMQQSLGAADFSVRFNQQLYATYLSYLDPARWQYGLRIKSDARGDLAEFIKSPQFGQIFVSRTRPGMTRGNHYHYVKTEKFLVLAGEGVVRLRHIEGSEILEYRVRGEEYRVVEIPPAHTHSITNVGPVEMLTLFWSSEVFDPDRPDTYFLPVAPGGSLLNGFARFREGDAPAEPRERPVFSHPGAARQEPRAPEIPRGYLAVPFRKAS
jgi:UDP-2-acetamido-2,6-beta-L-arabino-hexul-4-ose reductase